MLWKSLENFAADEAGAVTVDWVVLTAALVAMVFGVFTIVTQASVSVGANIINDTMVEAASFARETVEEQPIGGGEGDGEADPP